MRSIRKWSYETFKDDRAVQFVVMATPEDLDSNAEYIRIAEQYIEVPGGTNNNNYANVDLIVDIAERFNVDAVWAGWGHASENPELPEKLSQSSRKILFIGPPGNAMRSLGDKISSTIVAQHAKVPCIPWTGSDIVTVHFESDTGLISVDEDVAAQGACLSAEEGLEFAKEIGFPVMIKASEGGGGKGIRKVEHEKDFFNMYRQAVNEMPGSPIFIMKVVTNARHLEVQLLADQYGTNISLFGRDCSIQRRHQKIIEEAPVSITGDALFSEMEEAAVRLGKLVGYVSAGTVEYLYSPETNKYYFLELNPRLQVEHPVTEMISGVNLPAAQLQIAMGIPLHRISDIRVLYGLDPKSATEIDFNSQLKPVPKGHCIACRTTSEDPNDGFKPSSGNLHELNFRSFPNVWGYFSLGIKGGIHSYSDSQFGHVFASGESREAARKNLVMSLKELSIRGDFRTTVEYLIKLLESNDFTDNDISNMWLDNLISQQTGTTKLDTMIAVICGATTKAFIKSKSQREAYIGALAKGHVLNPSELTTQQDVEFIYGRKLYQFEVTQSAEDTFKLFINGSSCEVKVRELSDRGLLMAIGGDTHTVYWKQESSGTRLTVDSITILLENEEDPTKLCAPFPGKLVKYMVEDGDFVEKGQPYAELEIMKMQLPLISKHNGIITLVKSPSSIFSSGDLVATLKLSNSFASKPLVFKEQLPSLGPPTIEGTKPAYKFQYVFSKLNDILMGYDSELPPSTWLEKLVRTLKDPSLPYTEWQLQMSGLHSRIPLNISIQSEMIIDKSLKRAAVFPARQLRRVLKNEVINSKADAELENKLSPLMAIADKYAPGMQDYEFSVLISLLEQYYETEKLFGSEIKREEAVVLNLRNADKSNLNEVTKIVLSHYNVQKKNELVIAILDYFYFNCESTPEISSKIKPTLQKLVTLKTLHTKEVTLKVRKFLIDLSLPAVDKRQEAVEKVLKNSAYKLASNSVEFNGYNPDLLVLKELIDINYALFDVMASFLDHPDTSLATAAANVYIRRVYRAYTLGNIKVHKTDKKPIFQWSFQYPTDNFLPIPQIKRKTALKRIMSISELSYLTEDKSTPLRNGYLQSFDRADDCDDCLNEVLKLVKYQRNLFDEKNAKDSNYKLCNVITLHYHSPGLLDDETAFLKYFKDTLKQHREELLYLNIKRVTLMIGYDDHSYSNYFTFRTPHFEEDYSIRNIEPALAFQLELRRLANFHLVPFLFANRNIHGYKATSKKFSQDTRYFVRAIVRTGSINSEQKISHYLKTVTHKLLSEILDNFETIDTSKTDLNHIFINFCSVFDITPEDTKPIFNGILERFSPRLLAQHVSTVEIRIYVRNSKTGKPLALRAILNNTSGYVIETGIYVEEPDVTKKYIMKLIDGTGNLDMKSTSSPYPSKSTLQPKRQKAHLIGTTYAYDFPELLKQVAMLQWQKFSSQAFDVDKFIVKELTTDKNGKIIESSVEKGQNEIGLVAFLITIPTPEYPCGRQFTMLVNDVTHKNGSFGPNESIFFSKVTEYSVEKGIPRIYFSATYGARLGIAEELLPLFQVCWVDADDMTKGIEYIYLNDNDYQTLKKFGKKITLTKKITADGEVRHVIEEVIGSEEGIGVESLKGSALIAGMTAKAYKQIFTLSLITSNTVGIGAYLVRLGQRTIQIAGKPIILTGAAAINRLLGREVYSSNLQLGGPEVMYHNGVSHLTAKHDLDAIQKLIKWLSYVPSKINAPVPLLDSADTWDRDIDYEPKSDDTYDTHWLLEGRQVENGFELGFFDKDSFFETLSGWAKGVIVGRARLGGIPMGVIAVNTNTAKKTLLADPANLESVEMSIQEAGQVWYPNSSFKTAQAINDFNNGEQLPLIIFANWRGFSGGQRDMYNEILKYGSFIIDSLTNYQQPVMIYIPPTGELRGGSWVVIDPSINIEQMEMYADSNVKAGILEPEGMVGIKYRKNKIIETMTRLDKRCRDLTNSLKDASLSTEEIESLTSALKKRQEQLLPIYHQIAIQFSGLHEKVGRLVEKDAIRKVVNWKDSRRFFYWRVRRNLLENDLFKKAKLVKHDYAKAEFRRMIKSWLPSSINYENDREVANWLLENCSIITEKMKQLNQQLFKAYIDARIEKMPELQSVLSDGSSKFTK